VPVKLTAKLSDLCLPIQAEQRPQSFLHNLALGPESRHAQGIPHELVVDYDIGAHDVYDSVLFYTFTNPQKWLHHSLLPIGRLAVPRLLKQVLLSAGRIHNRGSFHSGKGRHRM